MKTRPLARRAGLDGFVTWFGRLSAAEATPTQILAAEPVDLGLDFSFLPRRLAQTDAHLAVACVLVAEHACEVGFSVGSYRGVRWQVNGESGATPDAKEEPGIEDGTGRWNLRAGGNAVILRLDVLKAGAYACLRLLDADGVRVGVPDAASNDPDLNAPPEYRLLNRPGASEPAEAFEFEAWHRALRTRWLQLLGEPAREQGSIVRALGESDEGAYVRREVRVAVPGEGETPAYLLVPKQQAGPAPGVLALHGHGFDAKDNVAGVDRGNPERRAYIARAGYDYGAACARRGFTVLVPDIRNFGARRDALQVASRYTRDQCDVQFFRGFVTGRLPAQTEALEWRAWLDVLAAQPSVDAKRLGVVGLSLGGRSSGLCAALDPRVKAAVVSGALNLMRERILLGQGCVKYMLPGLLTEADLPELYGLAAPRALFCEHGANDGTSPEVFAQEAWRRLRAIYTAAGAEDRLGLHVFDGGHIFNGKRSLDWLEEELGKQMN